MGEKKKMSLSNYLQKTIDRFFENVSFCRQCKTATNVHGKKELDTVIMNVPRRSGKTQALLEILGKNPDSALISGINNVHIIKRVYSVKQWLENTLETPNILMVDEWFNLDKEYQEKLKPYLDKTPFVILIGTDSKHKELHELIDTYKFSPNVNSAPDGIINIEKENMILGQFGFSKGHCYFGTGEFDED